MWLLLFASCGFEEEREKLFKGVHKDGVMMQRTGSNITKMANTKIKIIQRVIANTSKNKVGTYIFVLLNMAGKHLNL